MREIAENWLKWKQLAPLVEKWQSILASDVKADTRKIFSTEAFSRSISVDGFELGYGPTAPPYLLSHPDIRSLPRQR